MCAWGGINSEVLKSKDFHGVESGPLSPSEASFVVSIPNLGAIVATLIYSLSIDRFSRRHLLFSIAFPLLVNIQFAFFFIQNSMNNSSK